MYTINALSCSGMLGEVVTRTPAHHTHTHRHTQVIIIPPEAFPPLADVPCASPCGPCAATACPQTLPKISYLIDFERSLRESGLVYRFRLRLRTLTRWITRDAPTVPPFCVSIKLILCLNGAIVSSLASAGGCIGHFGPWRAQYSLLVSRFQCYACSSSFTVSRGHPLPLFVKITHN